jgi:hypothetical protein
MGLLRLLILAGAAVSAAAFALRKAGRAQAPSEGGAPESESAPSDPLDAVKRRAEEALAAAREARAEKEAELQRQFEEAKRGARR